MLEVRLLGQFEVQLDGRRLIIPTRNAQSLFAYLVLNAGKAHRREKLAGLLWPDSSEENARSNLRHELWRLRKVFEADRESYFQIDELSIAFRPQTRYSLDVQILEGIPLEDSTADHLSHALSFYQGELLPGFYEEWVVSERARLAALFEAKISRLLDILQNDGRWAEVTDWATRWIAMGQWPEPAFRALMTAYASTGNMSKAAAAYEQITSGMQKDLGVNTSAETQALFRRLKTGWKPDSPKSTPRRESQPAGDYLPKKRLSNLPRPLTSFIGREKEIQQVKHLVSKARLVTITGSGGVGKTRLAIQVAGGLRPQFEDGVWWVDLAPLFTAAPTKKRNPPELPGREEEPVGTGLVAQAIAKSLRIPDMPAMPLLDEVLAYLCEKRLLLVLDNCEHLIQACAVLADRLLSGCAEMSILATSREALGVPSEKAWRLPSLSLPVQSGLPDMSHILQSEAVSLFVARVGEVIHGYLPVEKDAPEIGEICTRLDGIPLAIELAAARMNLLSAREIAQRLDDRFSLLTSGLRTAIPRHQTLQAAIEWSYDLLSEIEKVILRRLAIFAGSFTLDAAEAICSSKEIDRKEVLALLGQLVNKSLLNVESSPGGSTLPTRYRYLDTIRSFGMIKLAGAEEIQLMHERHADYYVRLAEAAEPELLLLKQTYWFKLLQAEHDNLRAAIEWAAESDHAEYALRLAGALLWFWFTTGIREPLDLTAKALHAKSAIQFKAARARALNTAGFIQCLSGDTALARQSLDEALSILRISDDEASLAWTLQFLGLAASIERRYDVANRAFEEGLALSKKIMVTQGNSFFHFLGDIALLQGDDSGAKKIYEESASILREIGNRSFLAYPLRRLGYLALKQNDLSRAKSYFLESLALNHEVGDILGLTASLVSLAALALYLDKPIIAARLYGAIEKRLETYFINLLNIDQGEFGLIGKDLSARLDKASFAAAYTEGWEMSDEQAIEMAKKVEDTNA
jgi:predicted ATPase/DNA-binding SARP family transcriptional activator